MVDHFTLTADERDALYEHMLSHLTGLDDLTVAFQREDFDRAARLGIEFGDELRLMEDLGWGWSDSDDPVSVTMPRSQRNRVFSWLRAGVENLRRDEEREEAEVENEARDQRERAARIIAACDRALATVDCDPQP